MNHIQLLAHSLANRVPAMAQDCAINNAYLIEKEITAAVAQELAERDALLKEALIALTTPSGSSIRLGFACHVTDRQYALLKKLELLYEKKETQEPAKAEESEPAHH